MKISCKVHSSNSSELSIRKNENLGQTPVWTRSEQNSPSLKQKASLDVDNHGSWEKFPRLSLRRSFTTGRLYQKHRSYFNYICELHIIILKFNIFYHFEIFMFETLEQVNVKFCIQDTWKWTDLKSKHAMKQKEIQKHLNKDLKGDTRPNRPAGSGPGKWCSLGRFSFYNLHRITQSHWGML